MAETRLQKYLAEAGVASRRRSEELISRGRVEVNGATITEPGIKVTDADVVKVDGKEVKPEKKKIYILLNKPAGYVTTSKDQFSRKTVLDLVEGIKERIYPVGRLDYDTSGLILLTNDGELANILTHPSHETEKIYHVKIDGKIEDKDILTFKKGIQIDDYMTSPAKIRALEETATDSTIEVIIHEGRNRQVRRMCEAIGHKVLKLKRVSIGTLKLQGLEEGKWRLLTEKEVKSLRNSGK